MPPGIEKEELGGISNRHYGNEKTALYFGSMKRKDVIPHVCNLFSELEYWKLDLIGLKEGQSIPSYENVKYIGMFSHVELNSKLSNYDAILLPLPTNKYTEYIIPMKTCYTLSSCKPVIMSRLPGLVQFISDIGLSSNVIFIDSWDENSIKNALDESTNMSIDCERTQEILTRLDWSMRFDKLTELIFNDDDIHQGYYI